MPAGRIAIEWLLAVIQAQRDAGFADLAGADASLTLPVSDRLINQSSPSGCRAAAWSPRWTSKPWPRTSSRFA
jgi:hypothetical protein